MGRPRVHPEVVIALALVQSMLIPQASMCPIDSSIKIHRQLIPYINPGVQTKVNTTLLYVKAIGENDIIHNIWDFTYGTPSFLYAVTNLNTKMNVIWNGDKPKSFKFSKPPKYRFGLQINKIWEFNDVNDTAIFDPLKHEYHEFSTSDIKWDIQYLHHIESIISLHMTAKSIGTGKNKRGGYIKINVNLITISLHLVKLFQHSANSSLVELELENITLSHSFKKSRFAMELVMISTEKSEKSMEMHVRQGWEDENTPGDFEVIEIVTPGMVETNNGGILQYRPACFTEEYRNNINASVGLQTSDINNTTLKKYSTAAKFFDKRQNLTLLIENVTVSMGSPQDGFYNKSKFMFWAFAVGYGYIPIEEIENTLFVKMVLSIGIGIFVLLIIVGGLYICTKKKVKPDKYSVRLVKE